MGKKSIAFLLVVVAVGAWAILRPRTDDTLRIYTWSQYLPDEFLRQYERETGKKVSINFYSSNEELFAKIRAGASGYDLIQPSDYMVERLAKLKLLARLDKAQLPNLSTRESGVRNLPFDPQQEYSVPFIEGTTGIIINRDKIAIPPDQISWSLLFQSPDPAHTSFLDDMREVFAAAYLWQGADPNQPDAETLAKAGKTLREAKRTVASFTSEPLALLQRAEITLAHAFSYQAMEAIRSNPRLAFILPREGAVKWVDNFVIPASSKKQEAAHHFLNYVLDSRHIRELQAMNHLSIVGSGVSDADRTQGKPKALHYFRDLTETELAQMGQSWTELKSE